MGFINTHAQWTVPRPIKIINNSNLSYHYQIIHHSAFYDGTNDGIINGLNGPFNLSTLYSLWTADITGDFTVCDQVEVPPFTEHHYVEPSQNGLPVGTYSILNPNGINLTDYALYFRTFYLKGYLQGTGITKAAGAVRYPAPTTGLTTIPGTFGTYAYDPSTLRLFEISGSHPTFIVDPPYMVQFTEIMGVEYVFIS